MQRRAVPGILGSLIFLTLFAVLIGSDQRHAEKFFSDALRTYDISADVGVDGRRLEVRAGAVSLNGAPAAGALSLEALRLTYARTLAERNPLFALPGTSPSDLAYAVD